MKHPIINITLAVLVLGLSTVFGTMVPVAFATNGTNHDAPNPGSITVCKVIANTDGTLSNGSDAAGASFSIAGIEYNGVEVIIPAPVTEVLPTTVFTTPLTLNADLLGNDGSYDAACVTYNNLPLGSYFYTVEKVSGSGTWETPGYNDQHTISVSTLIDFFLFNGNHDDSQNTNADGHIVLEEVRPERTLVILNTFEKKDEENHKPVITLLGDSSVTLFINASYTDPGATASDEEDGDITDDIVVGGDTVNANTVGTYVITYNVSDSDGAAANQITRTVRVEAQNNGGRTPNPQCSDEADNDIDELADEEDPACHTDGNPDNEDSYDPNGSDENSKPVITRIGSETVTTVEDTSFTDPGATANDEEDGDITSHIVVNSNVNTETPGTYTVTYNVTDSDGLAANQVARTVTVTEHTTTSSGCVSNCGGGGGGGGTTITLDITNEAISLNSQGAAVITWTTNLQATSMVVYDVIPHGSSTTVVLPTDYALATSKTTAFVTSHSVTVQGLIAGKTYYFRPYSDRSDDTELGIELTITPTLTTAMVAGASPIITDVTITRTPCTEYLLSYIKLGENNDPLEVRKLEAFLKTFEGFTDLPVDGIYEQRDFEAVNVFQERYFDDVLSPWGHTKATGYVYYTTRKKINEIYCRASFPLTVSQLAEIEKFKALLESAIQSGGSLDAIDTSSVGKGSESEKETELAKNNKDGSLLEDILANPIDTSDKTDKSNLVARIFDAAIDQSRLTGIILIVLAVIIAGIGIVRARKKKHDDIYPPLS